MMVNLEADYSEKIDCRLDYYNLEHLKALFEEAKSISSECVFRFLEEVFNAPRKKSGHYNENLCLILNYANPRFEHPLKYIVLYAGISKLNGDLLPAKKVLTYMNEIKRFRNNFAALNVIRASIRFNTKFYMVDDFYESIVQHWSRIAKPS